MINKSIRNNKIVYKNAVITYDNEKKEIFDAIVITDKGVYTGHTRLDKDNNEEFIDDGLISKEDIKNIIIIDKEGISKEIVL